MRYTSSTPYIHLTTAPTTTIKRVIPSTGQKETIGTVKWKSFGKGKVHVGGQKVRFEGGGLFNETEPFKASDGRTYRWKITRKHIRLIHTSSFYASSVTIASFTRHHNRFLNPLKRAQLQVTSAGLPIMDDIITSFIYVEGMRRKREKAAGGIPGMGHAAAAKGKGKGGMMWGGELGNVDLEAEGLDLEDEES